MRLTATVALIGTVLVAAPASQSRSRRPTLERAFPAGGRIAMSLSAGEYEIAGAPDGRIHLDWSVADSERLDEVDNAIDVRGNEARISTDGPPGNFEVRIQVPARSDLHVRLTAGELTIKGVEGNKDVELHAGELDIDVEWPFPRVDTDGHITEGTVSDNRR